MKTNKKQSIGYGNGQPLKSALPPRRLAEMQEHPQETGRPSGEGQEREDDI
jgi:hypothetical protein